MVLSKLNHSATILFLTSIMTFPRSFVELKLVFLVLFILTYFLSSRKFRIFHEILFFYTIIAILGIVWSLVGYFNGGDPKGISDSFRLWFFWSIAYFIIFTLLRNEESLKTINVSVALSGILIFLINILGLLNYTNNLGILNPKIIKALWMNFGIHKGYIQITSHNIGSLFFIIPYLVSVYFRRDKYDLNPGLLNLSLLCTLILGALSGRRALWIVIIISPILISMLSYLTRSTHLLTKNSKKFIMLLLISVIIFFIGFYYLFQNGILGYSTIVHLKTAFSDSDPRSIQSGYLFEGFLKYPLFGSGFGMSTPYIRSGSSPWSYEMTYNQLLFNFGIIGLLIIFLLFLFFLYFVILLIRRNRTESIIAFSILVGFFSFAIGAYSNPYFGSFDFLLIIGMIPFLATFKDGYKISN